MDQTEITTIEPIIAGAIETAIPWPIKIKLPINVLGFKTAIYITITEQDFAGVVPEILKAITAGIAAFEAKSAASA
jgi:S-ribosylhomocysteine lyase LuxS involved in autoinducer biosynthesis